jgi:uncharacterized protein (DUF1697 family)
VLGSGNVLFSAPAASEAALAKKAERAMQQTLGRTFTTFVRSVEALRELHESDPFAAFELPAEAKRVVTFLSEAPKVKLKLPPEQDGARIVCVRDREIFSAYVPSPRGPVFMTLIQKTFGDAVTTRTWDTIRKLAADKSAGAAKGAVAKKRVAVKKRGRG